MIVLRLDRLPPSKNHAHRIYRGRPVLSQEVRDWREYVGWALREQATPEQRDSLQGGLSVNVWLRFPDAARDRRRYDVDGRLPQLMDALLPALGMDDDRGTVAEIHAYGDTWPPDQEDRIVCIVQVLETG